MEIACYVQVPESNIPILPRVLLTRSHVPCLLPSIQWRVIADKRKWNSIILNQDQFVSQHKLGLSLRVNWKSITYLAEILQRKS